MSIITKPAFWDNLYSNNKAVWDVGYTSTPLSAYFDQLKNKDLKILVPGAGNGYEVEYLFNLGFNNVYLLDFSSVALNRFIKRVPDFPEHNLINEDFNSHIGSYDLIIEQTFFSSLPMERRNHYVKKMYELLKPQSKLVGLLFNHSFNKPYPPFGGLKAEYEKLFETNFIFKTFEISYNSIKPRQGRELFFIFVKKTWS